MTPFFLTAPKKIHISSAFYDCGRKVKIEDAANRLRLAISVRVVCRMGHLPLRNGSYQNVHLTVAMRCG